MEPNIAILILAHHKPEQLHILIEHLQPGFDLYVQIDQKSQLRIADLPQFDNVYYYKEVEVYWGDFSQVLNMKHILEQAYARTYTHYLYISGDDLPIQSNRAIKNFFAEHPDQSFMYVNPLPIKTWGFNHGFDRLDRFWYMKIQHRKIAKIIGRTTHLIQKLLGIKQKRFPLPTYYAGSNWLNLTHAAATEVFNFLDDNPAYLQSLKYSRATDEMWIQSIVMNSSLKDKVIHNDLRYIDWETGPERPRILNQEDYTLLQKSTALFARKFDLGRDHEFVIEFLQNLK